MMCLQLQRIATVLIVGAGASSAFVRTSSRQSSHHSESGYSSSSQKQSSHSYSHTSKSAQGPGYSYSYSYTNEGAPLFLPYASAYHSYTPLLLSLIDLDLDFDLDDDLDDLDFLIDTDLDLDLDLDIPGIGYGLGYIGRYGHYYRTPRIGFSRLYRNIDSGFWNYGGRYSYDPFFTEPSTSSFGLGSLSSLSFDFFK